MTARGGPDKSQDIMTEYEIIRGESLSTKEWSGGTTTQLGIWPAGSDYAARDFTWRVSSARVEAEESVFTPLPGVDRTLMVLDGHLSIEHEGHHAVELDRYEQDSFSGDWHTVSRGRATDFNLMTRGAEGRVQLVDTELGGDAEVLLYGPAAGWGRVSEVFYFLGPEASVELPDGRTVEMRRGDQLVAFCDGLDALTPVRIVDRSHEGALAVRAIIYH